MNKNVCRVCFAIGSFDVNESVVILQQNDDKEEANIMSVINTGADQILGVRDMLNAFSSQNVTEMPDAPQTVCRSCLDELISSFKFMLKVRKSEDFMLAEGWILLNMQENVDEKLQSDIAMVPKQESAAEEETNHVAIKTLNAGVLYEQPEFANEATEGNCENALAVTNATDNEVDAAPISETLQNVELEAVEYNRVISDEVATECSEFIESNSSEEYKPNLVNIIEAIEHEAALNATMESQNQQNNMEVKKNNESLRIFACSFCRQAFSAEAFLIAHQQRAHICKFCKETFEQTSHLFLHLRQKHSDNTCDICSKRLTTRSNLRSHIRKVHHMEPPENIELLAIKQTNSIQYKTQEMQPMSYEVNGDFQVLDAESCIEEADTEDVEVCANEVIDDNYDEQTLEFNDMQYIIQEVEEDCMDNESYYETIDMT